MAWQDDAVMMLRVLINDIATPATYSDAKLEELMVVSARYVNHEIDFDNTYTISICDVSITPDPTTKSTDGEVFMNFFVLKAACLIDQNLLRTKAAIAGLKARCGPAVMETLRHLDGFNTLIDKGACAAYTQLKFEHEVGNANAIRAVLSPFISNDFDPWTLRAQRGSDNPQSRGEVF